jgi:hypothetical protein
MMLNIAVGCLMVDKQNAASAGLDSRETGPAVCP